MTTDVNPDRGRLHALAQLAVGQPPRPRDSLGLLVGLDALLDGWRRDLDGYVRGGGSLLRIVAAPAGAGKTHLGEALKATAAELGYLVARIDAQADGSATDDLALYRAVCRGLTLPDAYLDGRIGGSGLLALLQEAAERAPDDRTLRRDMAAVRAPMPALPEALLAVIAALRSGQFDPNRRGDEGWRALLTVLAGDRPHGLSSLGRLRQHYPPGPFQALRRLPGRRDARLWLESLLLLLRPLGFPGAVFVLDEHDDEDRATLDRAIVQLRRHLDRLAEGHLPGTFLLYLVLDDFPERLQQHVAVEQRVVPILRDHDLPARLLNELDRLREPRGRAFLRAVAERLHARFVGPGPLPSGTAAVADELAGQHLKIGERPDTRAFVKAFARHLEDLE